MKAPRVVNVQLWSGNTTGKGVNTGIWIYLAGLNTVSLWKHRQREMVADTGVLSQVISL